MLISQPDKIFISSANVDMRMSIDGLSSIVEQCFQLSRFDGAMFVFHNRHCDKIKILYRDSDGLCQLFTFTLNKEFLEVNCITKERCLERGLL